MIDFELEDMQKSVFSFVISHLIFGFADILVALNIYLNETM